MAELGLLSTEIKNIIQRAAKEFCPDAGEILLSIIGDRVPPESMLPLASCLAVDGKPEAAVFLSAAYLSLLISIRCFDDLEDQDRPDRLWATVGPDRAWNYASQLQLLCYAILNCADLPETVFHRIHQGCLDAFFTMAAGQDADLRRQAGTLEDYWHIAERKSGSAFSFACVSGAILGTTDENLIQACAQFGQHLGLAVQIMNDLDSIWNPAGKTDIHQGKITLPLLYGISIDHPHRQELLSYTALNALDQHADRIVEILDSIGTKSFLTWAALQERKKALHAFWTCPNREGKEYMEAYITSMFGDIAGD